MNLEEFTTLAGTPAAAVDFARANAVYMALQNVSKQDFALLYRVYGMACDIFAKVETLTARHYELTKAAADELELDLAPLEQSPVLARLDAEAAARASIIRAEMERPAYWTNARLDAVKKAVHALTA